MCRPEDAPISIARKYFIHSILIQFWEKTQRQDIQVAFRYRQAKRGMGMALRNRQRYRRPFFRTEGYASKVSVVDFNMDPPLASRGHTQCGIASGMGAESGSGNSNVQKNKEVNADNKFGIDVILMNHNMPNIQNVIDLLGGD